MSESPEKKVHVGKRNRVKTTPFEFNESSPSPRRKSSPGEHKVLVYPRNEFLAVRNDEGGFFLCRAQQHVFENTKTFNIQWLEEDPETKNKYNSVYMDTMALACVLTDVKLQRATKEKYLLPLDQRAKAEKALNKATKGGEAEESSEDDDEESDDSDDEESEEPPKKKTKKVEKNSKSTEEEESEGKKGKSEKKAGKGVLSKKAKLKKTSSVLSADGIKKKVIGKTVSKGDGENGVSKKTGKKTKNSKGVLVPRPSVVVWEKDPFLSTKEKMPFISTFADSKLLLRAVYQDDNKLLKEYIEDREHIAKVNVSHSEGFDRDALQIALERENVRAIQLLANEFFSPPKDKQHRVALTRSLLMPESTGHYNNRSLHGVQFVRKLNMSRGSKEGNNAFTKDFKQTTKGFDYTDYVNHALERGVSKDTLYKFCATSPGDHLKQLCYSHVYIAIRMGHRKLAAELTADLAKTGLTNFNFLHQDVLSFDNEDLKPGIKAASVQKKPFDNCRITPLHCAAINPNPKYLSKLLTILPEYNITDSNLRRPIHYAAACEGTGPLEFLLDRGVNPGEVDNQGMTALLLACYAGRVHNVELLLSRAKQDAEKRSQTKASTSAQNDDDAAVLDGSEKYGTGGVNQPVNKPQSRIYSYTSLHVAAEEGRSDVMKVLLEYGADVNKELSASKNKLTPLMVAASAGHLHIMRLLLKHGAKVNHKDKLKRTSLMLAAMNGHAHIVSFLLNQGCGPSEQDSSGNAAIHYAAGYGWYFCLKILLESGANPNMPNDWKTTPLAVAFLKGHIGLADMLLEQPSMDINFRLDAGMTLVQMACSSALVDGIVEQLEYLVIKKNADCTLIDDSDANALHHLAKHDIKLNRSSYFKTMATSVKMAEILLEHGCDASAKDDTGMTPVMYAVQQDNQPLIEFLVEKGANISNAVDKENKNILHFLSERCMTQSLHGILNMIKKTTSDSDVLAEMAKQVDSSGMTPLICACLNYCQWNGDLTLSDDATNATTQPDNDDDDNDDDDNDKDDDEDHEDADDEDGDGDDDNVAEENDDEEEEGKLTMDVDDGDGEEEKEEENRSEKDDSKTSIPPHKRNAMETAVAVQWEAGRKYISALVQVDKSSVGIALQKKQYKKTDVVPEKEEDQYFKKEVAGFSAVHFMLNVPKETPIYSPDGSTVSDACPGLTSILESVKNKRDADLYDCSGRTPLIAAVVGKHKAASLKLIDFGVDVNAKSRDKDKDGFSTPLVLAAKVGLHSTVQSLLKHGANVTDKDAGNQYTALHYVVRNPVADNSFSPTVAALLTHKASATEVDKHQKTPLHLLMEFSRGHADAVAVAGLLLNSGALIDACDRKGRTPLHLAVNANSGDSNSSTEMEQFLLDKGANQFARDWLQRLPLHYVFVKIGNHRNVSSMDSVELCSTLTGSTNKPGSMVNYGDQFGLTPLHVAARRGAGVCCIHLIKKGSNINGRDFDGNTPLSLAIANKHESCTILLLQQKADINGNIVIVPPPPDSQLKTSNDDDAADDGEKQKKKKEKPEWKWKPLRVVKKTQETQTYSIFQGVIRHEWQGIIFMMLDLLETFSMSLLNVVQAALVTVKYHLALSLIRKVQAKNELTNKLEHGQNLAHILAISSRARSDDNLIAVVAQLLMDKGVAFHLEDDYGCTPLHYACLQGNKPLALFIIKTCKNINLTNTDKLGRTPMAATFWGLNDHAKLCLEVAKILHAHKASLDLLCMYPNQNCVSYDTRHASETEDYLHPSPSNTLISPLMLAVFHHDFQLAHELITLGASVNFADIEGRTPLMLAVAQDNVHLVRLLLDPLYTITADVDDDDDDEMSAAAVPAALKKQPSLNVFKLGKGKLQKQPSVQKSIVTDAVTGSTTTKIFVNGLNMSYKTYPKVSSVDEKALDCRGRSALHYLVQPLPDGSRDNHRLLQQLVAIGAPLQQADKDGKTVLDHAMEQGLAKLSTAVQYLLDKKKKSFDPPKYAISSVDDGVQWQGPIPDYTRDSDVVLEEFEKTMASEEGLTLTEYKAVPDQSLSGFTTGQVLIDVELNLPYDVLLSKIDVAAGVWGLYNFYKMQIVYQKGKDLYILFTRWGRIGDRGQFQQTPFPRLEEVVKEFRKIFRSKTANDWQQIKSFEHKPRKYRLVPLEQRSLGNELTDVSIDLSVASLPSKLHPYVQDLIKELTDVKALSNSMDKLGVDRSVAPLGRMKKDTLLKAKEILVKIKKSIEKIEKLRSQITNTDMTKYEEELGQISRLTNEYYHLIPKRGFEYERIPILDNQQLIQSEWKNIETLLELEIATKIMIGAQHHIKDVNPLDYVYRCLQCKIQLMDENETEAQYLLRYVTATWKGKVEAIFRIARDGEDERLRSSKVDNRKLLFHGSSSSNLISILSKGLLIAPADAPRCGNMFGNGIYTADLFTKSLGYCFNFSVDSKVKYMLVCEVALGKCKDIVGYEYQETVPKGYQSVHGLGQTRPNPQFDLTLPSGAVIPLGSSTKHDKYGNKPINLADSEYIVYKEDQLCLRYIIQFVN